VAVLRVVGLLRVVGVQVEKIKAYLKYPYST
jgi:hypothetical protein